MRLSNRVEAKDIEEGVRLMRTAMQQSATDPKTGQIDMDIITTGHSFSSNSRVKEICDYIKKVQVSNLSMIVNKTCLRGIGGFQRTSLSVWCQV